jgi:electron transfer flavoprotein beta subunit
MVPVKRVVDPNAKVRVKPDGSGVDLSNLKMSINPFDEIAVEEAVRLKEKGLVSEIVCVSIGPPRAEEAIRSSLALGADRGILVGFQGELEPLAVAKILKAIALEEAPNLIILGSRRSTMTAIRPVKCSLHCLAGRKAPSPRKWWSRAAR